MNDYQSHKTGMNVPSILINTALTNIDLPLKTIMKTLLFIGQQLIMYTNGTSLL